MLTSQVTSLHSAHKLRACILRILLPSLHHGVSFESFEYLAPVYSSSLCISSFFWPPLSLSFTQRHKKTRNSIRNSRAQHTPSDWRPLRDSRQFNAEFAISFSGRSLFFLILLLKLKAPMHFKKKHHHPSYVMGMCKYTRNQDTLLGSRYKPHSAVFQKRIRPLY